MITNKSLKQYNTFGIDVKARCFAEYESEEDLLTTIRLYREQMTKSVGCIPALHDATRPVLHIGGGSNLLFLDDYDGLVLHNAIRTMEVISEQADDVVLRVGGGMVFDDLVERTLRMGYFGLENLSLIPGEVGASAVQNIGAYGAEAKDYITLVELMDLQTGEKKTLTNRECQYAYRYSILKSPEVWGRYAVTYVHYHLHKSFVPRLEYGATKKAFLSSELLNPSHADEVPVGLCFTGDEAIRMATELRRVIIEMRQSKLPDPHVLGNAGSFFMNPIVPVQKYEELQALYPDMPHFAVDEQHVKIPAGWMIDQCGWKGRDLGPAGVYEKQALVLVNRGGAAGADIVRLCDAVRADVAQKFGIDIHPEVNFI